MENMTNYVDWLNGEIESQRNKLKRLFGWEHKICRERIKAYENALKNFEIFSKEGIDNGEDM